MPRVELVVLFAPQCLYQEPLSKKGTATCRLEVGRPRILGLPFETVGQPYKLYGSAIEFLESYDPSEGGCLVLDIRIPRMTGLDLQEKLNAQGSLLPIIFITGHGDIQMAVEAMRRGALDFIRKPFREEDLLDRIDKAMKFDVGERENMAERQQLLDKVATLTEREREVFNRVADGEMNKVIAMDMGISARTVEVHRSRVMHKLGIRTLAQLVRIRIEAERLRSSE